MMLATPNDLGCGAEQARYLARLSVLGPDRFAAERARQLGHLTKLAPLQDDSG